MKKIHSIPYGYEVHRLEAGKKKVEREKYGDKNSFRSLDIDESKVDYIGEMAQFILINVLKIISPPVRNYYTDVM